MISVSEHAFKLMLIIKEASPQMLDKLRNEFSKLFGSIEMVTKATKNWKKELLTLSALGLANVVLGIGAASKIMIQLNDRVAIMAQRFGVSRDQIGAFTDQMYKVANAAGIVVDQIAEMTHELMDAGYKGRTKEMVGLSASVFKFAEVTGISAKTSATFTAELSKVGVNSLYLMDKLATLRRNLQLSTAEFETVMKVTEDAAKAMYAYGNAAGSVTANQINKLSGGIANISAMFGTLGISAGTTQKLLSGLVDPNVWLDNQQMFIALGFNIDEVFDNIEGRSKTFQNTEQMLSRFSQGMRRLTEGGGFWLAHWAKVTGIPADELVRISKGFQNVSEDQKMAMKQQQTVNELWSQMGATITPLQRAVRQLFASFILAIKPAIDVLSLFITTFASWLQGVGKYVQGISEGLGKMGGVVKNVIGVVMLVAIGMIIKAAYLAGKAVLGFGASVANLSREMGGLAVNTTAATGALANFAKVSTTATGATIATGAGALGAGLTGAVAGTALKMPSGWIKMLVGLFGANAVRTALTSQLATTLAAAFRGVMKMLPGIIGVGITAFSVFGTKKFTAADLGTLLLTAGIMTGFLPATIVGGMLLAMSMFKNFTLFHFDKTGLHLGGPKAENVAEEIKRPVEARNIQDTEREVSTITKEQRERWEEEYTRFLKEIMNNTKGTTDAVKQGHTQQDKQHRETLYKHQRENVRNNADKSAGKYSRNP